MSEFKLIKELYLKLRETHINFLDKFDERSYFYKPTEKSNSTAWIVPHCPAFEKVMIIDKIEGYVFEEFISAENVAKYRPGVDGFKFKEGEMMGIEEAKKLLLRTKEASIKFIDEMIERADSVKNVDKKIAKEKFLFNFRHETEHLGQLKYLIGTWKRMKE